MRGFGQMLGLGNAFAAFAGGFDGHVQVTGTSQGLKLPGIWVSYPGVTDTDGFGRSPAVIFAACAAAIGRAPRPAPADNKTRRA